MAGWARDGCEAGESWVRLLWSPRAVAVWAGDRWRGGVLGVVSATAAVAPFWPIFSSFVDEPFGTPAVSLTLGLVILSGLAAAVIVPVAVLLARAGRVMRVLLLAWTPLLLPLGCFYGWSIYYLLRYYPSFGTPAVWRPSGVEVWIDATVGSCAWLLACVVGWVVIAVWALVLLRAIPPRQAHACAACGYDLRGSVAAGSTACPECGEAIALSRGCCVVKPES